MFDDESSASHGWVFGDGPSSHVKMQGTDDVDAGLGLKQPELGPEPGVEVDQLEASVPRVESPVEIYDSPEPNAQQNLEAYSASVSLGTVTAHVVAPALRGHDRTFTPVNATRDWASWSQYAVDNPALGVMPRDVLLQPLLAFLASLRQGAGASLGSR